MADSTTVKDRNMEKHTKMTLRLPKGLHDRMKLRLLAEGTNFQAKILSLIENYVDGPAEKRADITRQVAIAREAMKRYAPAMRELAR